MPEFEYIILDTTVRGVCATDATDEVIQAAILDDLLNAKAGEERRLEDAQVVYTVVPETVEPLQAQALDLNDEQRAALPGLEAGQHDDPAAHVAVTGTDTPAPAAAQSPA